MRPVEELGVPLGSGLEVEDGVRCDVRVSTRIRYTSWSTHPEQYSREVALDLAWGDQTIRASVLPR